MAVLLVESESMAGGGVAYNRCFETASARAVPRTCGYFAERVRVVEANAFGG
jgi:hypothetical protein